ncbi:MAG: hypothetical protein LBK29_00020, partial [Oscillospiraceae bacterium]|nr:hypothetical protein [Oscillospiraceae bacterium]
MKNTYEISAEQAKELQKKIKMIKNKTACNRMEILTLLDDGKTPKKVSEIKKEVNEMVNFTQNQLNREDVKKVFGGKMS